MADNETIADILAEKRTLAAEMEKALGDQHSSVEMLKNDADRLEAAHKREVGALRQRCNELNAEVAAKDEVIKRLNDAIAEEQKRKMATAENPSAVGDAAKLREALGKIKKWAWEILELKPRSKEDDRRLARGMVLDCVTTADRALAAPPRNCDVGVPEERIQRWSKFCKARSKKLPPIHGFEWEDYPYEEGGDK